MWHCLIDRCGPVATLLCLFVYLISLSVQLHIAPIFAEVLGLIGASARHRGVFRLEGISQRSAERRRTLY
jgi:hypothetical protein